MVKKHTKAWFKKILRGGSPGTLLGGFHTPQTPRKKGDFVIVMPKALLRFRLITTLCG